MRMSRVVPAPAGVKYYNFADDLALHPEAWLYVVWSRRGPGKTYSSLLDAAQHDKKIVYMKRTNDDVKILTSTVGGVSMSPYAPINRDFGTDIRLVPVYMTTASGNRGIMDGIAAIVPYTDGGERMDDEMGVVMSLNKIKSYKGFDLSTIDEIIFDEFMPQPGEQTKRKEGEMLLSFYMTANRDRVARGLPEIKLVLFANTESLWCPITLTLDLIDTIADMESTGTREQYDERRRIFYRSIDYSASITEDMGIVAAMRGTQWGRAALEGEFSYIDKSAIRRTPLNKYSPVCGLSWMQKYYYVYEHKSSGELYMCSSRAQGVDVYNLDEERDQRRYWLDYGIDFRQAVVDHAMYFQSYTMYNIVYNFTSLFKI